MSSTPEKKKPSRRKTAEAAEAQAVTAAVVEVESPPAKKKAPAKKVASATEKAEKAAPVAEKTAAAKKPAAKKPAAKKAALKKTSKAETPAEPEALAEDLPAAKPARKPAPRKKKAEITETPAPPPAAPVLTALQLQAGPEMRLQWIAGDVCPPELAALAQAGIDEHGGLPAELSHELLAALVAEARKRQHPLAVAPEVWAQLALKRDAEGRVRRLTRLMAEPGADWLLACPQYQLEAALFAVSAGRALLADDLGIGQRDAAVAALRLWREGFGLEQLAVLAPASRHAAWRAALPEGVRLASDPQALAGQVLDVLVVDAIETWDLAALTPLQSTHLHLLANSEPLRDERLAAWVDWLDVARRGPVARLAALPAVAGARERREAVETVVLSRRKREFAEGLPERLDLVRELATSEAPAATRERLHAACARWQRLGHATEAERAVVLAELQALRAGELEAALLNAQAQALRELAEEWSPLSLRVAAEPAKLAALAPLLADRPELLMASDKPTALVHLDLPWSAAALARRYAGLPAGRGLPVAWLLPVQGLSAALKAAPLPDCFDEASPWWSDEDWAALMAALPTLAAQ